MTDVSEQSVADLSVPEVLSRVADLIEPAGAWMQGDFCNTLSVNSASCWCVEGAVAHVRGMKDCMAAEMWCDENLVPLGLFGRNVADWNDAPERTQAEVVAALRSAALRSAALRSAALLAAPRAGEGE